MFMDLNGFLSILILLLPIGLGFLVFRRLFGRRDQPYPYQMNMPPQQRYGPPQGYRPPSDYSPGYGRPFYGPSYPQQGYPVQGGINPWVAGGLGALGGGLVGYELGQAMADNEQLSPESALANAESTFDGIPQGDYAQLGSEAMDVEGWDMGGSDVWGGDSGGKF